MAPTQRTRSAPHCPFPRDGRPERSGHPRAVARFLDGSFDGKLVDPASLALMIDCRETINATTSRRRGFAMTSAPDESPSGPRRDPVFSAVAMRTTTGRNTVLYQTA